MDLSVLVVQNNAIIGNKTATFNNVEKIVEKFLPEKPDIIVLPEVWAAGWCCSIFKESAESIENSVTIAFLKNLALNANSLVIGGSFIQKSENNTYKNTCPVISKEGKLITTYDKLHLFSHKGSEENKFIQHGNELKILNLGFTKIGLSICYDIRFPEIYREYSQNGAEIFVNMAAWSITKPQHWEIMHRARAIENQCYMIVADQTGKISDNEYNLGHSMVIDPWGDVVSMLHEEEDCFICNIDTKKVHELRKNFPLINDRRDDGFYSFRCKEINVYE